MVFDEAFINGSQVVRTSCGNATGDVIHHTADGHRYRELHPHELNVPQYTGDKRYPIVTYRRSK